MRAFGWFLMIILSLTGAYFNILTYQIDHSILVLAGIVLFLFNSTLGVIGVIKSL